MTRDSSTQSSQPDYEMTVDPDRWATMRDGTRLAVDVYRPDSSGRFPALLSIHAYCKDTERTSWLGPRLRQMSPEYAGVEAGDHEFWARHGYVHVIADARGTAKSEGAHYGLFSPQEQQDGHDLVEWVAAQDWCDGNVGMCGISYLGIIQFFVAAQRPPHLKAIFPHDAWGDLYRDIMYQGGMPGIFGFTLDAAIPFRHGLPNSPRLYGEQELARQVKALLDDEATSLADSPAAIKALSSPHAHPIAFDTLVNREDGPYWRERSAVEQMDRIEVPTYLGSELHAYTTSLHLPGVSWGWERITAPKKLALRPCRLGGLDRPFYEIHDEMLRWYDHWLKGLDTGIMDEPPVKIWVRGREAWRYAEQWPLLADTQWTRAYLRGDGRLTLDEPPAPGEPLVRMRYEPAVPVVINPRPFSPRPEFLTYATEPFQRDIEVVGPAALYLRAALSSQDGDFVAVIKDVEPDGSELVLTRGWLRASHRATDPDRSEPWRPFHTHTDPTPLAPGEQYEFAIEVRPLANLFAAGHRLKLEIWPWDYPNEPYYDWTLYWGKGQHIPYGREVSYEVFHDSEAPSYLLLPVMRD